MAGDPIGWGTIAATALLAVIAEIFEFSLSARYTKKYGGSRPAVSTTAFMIVASMPM